MAGTAMAVDAVRLHHGQLISAFLPSIHGAHGFLLSPLKLAAYSPGPHRHHRALPMPRRGRRRGPPWPCACGSRRRRLWPPAGRPEDAGPVLPLSPSSLASYSPRPELLSPPMVSGREEEEAREREKEIRERERE